MTISFSQQGIGGVVSAWFLFSSRGPRPLEHRCRKRLRLAPKFFHRAARRGWIETVAARIKIFPEQILAKVEGPQTIKEQFERYVKEYNNYDFFFIHFKYTDKAGEDGNFEAKKKYIEEFDAALPILLGKKPDVLAITGDHSTPCAMKGHSWHPQPVLLHSKICGSDKLERFTETGANLGSLGVFEAKFLMRHMQANAKAFDKYGA